MKVVTNEWGLYVDVDDTLVFIDKDIHENEEGKVAIIDPYLGSKHFYRINKHMVKMVKRYKKRGRLVIVWSHGGVAWAEAVIRALKLTDYVDYIMPKVETYFDDKTFDEQGCSRVYFK